MNGVEPVNLRFGIMIGPFHTPVGQDPTVAYQRDLETIKLIESLDFDEAWIGEHHSAGAETIPDPALFIAHVAAQTSRIKLGAGVVSLPYHNPLWVADRMMFLDHLTRGRMMMGVGPGVLAEDARMVGIAQKETRPALEQDLDVLMQLLMGDEPVSIDTGRYRLVEARSQYRPYTYPCFEIAVAAVASPSGPRLAAKYGTSLLSMGATKSELFDLLSPHWKVLEELAPEYGHVPDRRKWRLFGLMHLAETRDKAIEEVRFGLDPWCDYASRVLGTPQLEFGGGDNFAERVEFITGSGLGVIGTVEDAILQIERLWEQSGGFGCFGLLHHEWAVPAGVRKSYELFARYVKPHFQRRTDRLQAAQDFARMRRADYFAEQDAAIKETFARHEAERAAKRAGSPLVS